MKSHHPSRLCLGAALLLLSAAVPVFARQNQQPPPPPPNIRQGRPIERPTNRPYPNEGRIRANTPHLAQWMENHRNLSLPEQQRALQNEPGAEFNYNNSGFSLATTVLERVTGRPFNEWMREEVFLPLGMTHTWVRSSPGMIVPNR